MERLSAILILLASIFVLYEAKTYVAKQYRVVSIVNAPFLRAPDTNGKYSGYIFDILEAMKADGDFNYTIQIQADGVYGDFYENGTVTGLISTVNSGKADIAAADLTVTQNRSKAVDFTSLIFGSVARVAVNDNYNNQTAQYYVILSSSLVNYLNKTQEASIIAIWNNLQGDLKERQLDTPEKISAVVQRMVNGENVALVGETPGLNIAIRGHDDKIFFLTGSFYTNFFCAGRSARF